MVGAGLFGRSLLNVLDVNPGFRVDGIVTMDVALPWLDDPKAKAGQAVFFSRLIDRLRQIPGVRNVGAASGLPMDEDGGLPDGNFLLMTQEEMPKTTKELLGGLFQQKERIGNADFCVATGDYFRVLGIPLIRGRLFDDRDGADAPHVAVITESLARSRWPGQDPVGHTIEFGNMDGDFRLLTIVGIVGDTHVYGLDRPPRPTVYVNLFQRPRAAISLTLLSDARYGVDHLGSAGHPAGSRPRDPGEVPDAVGRLFGVARLAEIQRHPHRVLRDHRAAAGHDGGVRRDGATRSAAARGKSACASRSGRPRATS